MAVKVIRIQVSPFMTNCYVVIQGDTKEAIVIDPGDDGDVILQRLRSEQVTLKAILLTHGHLDHFLATDEILATWSVPVYAEKHELEVLADPEKNLTSRFLNQGVTYEGAKPLNDGEELVLANIRIRVIHTPGHTPGGCCYYLPEEGILFSGDTLFARSVGNTEFPGGSTLTLMHSIREKLYVLAKETVVYAGHGETTDIGTEMEENPFVPAGGRKDS